MKMPSYKKHILFSLFIALPFFPDVFYLSLAVIGASVIDLDHHVRKRNLRLMALSGLLLAGVLYILNLPYILGVILFTLALIFYISKHRGFMHSFFGITIITAFLTIFVIGSYLLLQGFSLDLKVSLIIISLALGLIILNKKLILLFILAASLGVILTNNMSFNPYYVFIALFLGCISHIMLDLFTPSGLKLFNPISNRRYNKTFGIFLMILWGLTVGLFLYGRIGVIFHL